MEATVDSQNYHSLYSRLGNKVFYPHLIPMKDNYIPQHRAKSEKLQKSYRRVYIVDDKMN